MSEATRAALAAAVTVYLAECAAAAIPGTVPRDGLEFTAVAHLRSEGGREKDMEPAVVPFHQLAQRILADEPVTTYWHGTDDRLSPGDVLTPAGANQAGRRHPESNPEYLYFTGVRDDAAPHGAHIYQVVPMGPFEEDLSVFDEGYRTAGGLLIVG